MSINKKDLEIQAQNELALLENEDNHSDERAVEIVCEKYFTVYKNIVMTGYMGLDNEDRFYVMDMDMVKKYAAKLKSMEFFPTILYGCATEDERFFMLPIYNYLNPNSAAYTEKLFQIVEAGYNGWVKISQDFLEDANTDFEIAPLNQFPHNEIELTEDEIASFAFGDEYVVRNLNHPIFKW